MERVVRKHYCALHTCVERWQETVNPLRSPYTYEVHLPAEEAWLPEMYLVLAVALLCYVPVYRGMIKQHQLVGKSRDHITLWVTLVLACQIFHVASEEIHLLSIQFYGEGWRTLGCTPRPRYVVGTLTCTTACGY